MTVCAGLIPPFLILPLRKPRMLFLAEVTRVLAWEPDIRVLAARLLPGGDGTDGKFVIEADVEVVT